MAVFRCRVAKEKGMEDKRKLIVAAIMSAIIDYTDMGLLTSPATPEVRPQPEVNRQQRNPTEVVSKNN